MITKLQYLQISTSLKLIELKKKLSECERRLVIVTKHRDELLKELEVALIADYILCE